MGGGGRGVTTLVLMSGSGEGVTTLVQMSGSGGRGAHKFHWAGGG